MSGLEIGVLAAGAVLLLGGIFGGPMKLGKAPRLLVGIVGVAAIGYASWLFYQPQMMAHRFQQTADDAFVACHAPGDAAKPPDGNTASKDDMIAGQKSAKTFDSQTTAYVTCLDVAGEHLKQQFSALVPQGEIMKMDERRVQLHNAAIDKDEAQANGFNVQLRLYKAKQPAAQP